MLIDTHILLWILDGVEGNMGKLTTKKMLYEFGASVVSAASLLEIRLKQRRGKLQHLSVAEIAEQLSAQHIPLLSVLPSHCVRVAQTDEIAHADPFDLLLVAQAITENLPLLTCDKKLLALNLPGLQLIDGHL